MQWRKFEVFLGRINYGMYKMSEISRLRVTPIYCIIQYSRSPSRLDPKFMVDLECLLPVMVP